MSSTESGKVPLGAWGGKHIALTVTERDARFEIDCAHGTIAGPLSLDANCRFSSSGFYVSERNSMEREGSSERRPARYTGWSDGKRMTLTIVLTDTGQVIGEFNLTLGTEPQITKCL
jgi:hypothetical protein